MKHQITSYYIKEAFGSIQILFIDTFYVTYFDRMVPGKLIDLETETTEPYWSVNVKRGLLSFMQLDLMEEERVRVDPDELRILNKLNIATPPTRSPNKAYRVMEVKL